MSDDNDVEVASPEVTKLREEVGYLTNAFFVLGNGNIKATEAEYACKLLKFMDGLLKAKTDELNSRIATEELGRPVKMIGTVITPEAETH